MIKKGKNTNKFPIHDQTGLLSTRKAWSNLFKGDKLRLVFITSIFLFISGLLIYIFYGTLKLLIKSFFEVINRNFGKILASELVRLLFSSFFLGMILTIIIFWIIFSFTKKMANKWFILTLFLISFVAIFGFFALDSVVGNAELSLFLRDSNNIIIGKVKCEGPLGPIIVGGPINCETDFYEKETFIFGEEKMGVTLTINNGERFEKGFTARENTTYFGLRIFETNLNWYKRNQK